VQLTVVVPTYNEADNLPKLVSALLALPIDNLRIFVVDDNSPDGTGDLAEELAIKHPGRIDVLHRAGKLGLGSAYRMGFRQVLQTDADAIAQMDADFSHPPELLVPLLEALQNSDAALGSRYIPGGGVDERWPIWRQGLSAFGNIYARTILRLPVRDATGGYRVWRRETLIGMPLEFVRSNGYAFQVEMAYVAYRLGFTFQEVPFYFADRRWGDSKMSFKIQREAALRVWEMLYVYRNLNHRQTK
jgi:dolichol-phosphate mannosyltransferase